jgi:hypothetical protein
MPQSNAVLQEFPGPLTLYPSTRRWVTILLACLLFDAGGLWMIAQSAPGGWYVLIVFALFTIIAAAMLLPRAASLQLDRDGFETTSLFRRHRTFWQDVTGFEPVAIPPAMHRVVAYDNVKGARSALAKLNVAIAGHNAALPETYGLSAEELCAVMAQWRERALASQPRA